MNKIIKEKSLLLVPIGLLIIAFSQILTHYIVLPDLIKGLLSGVGIGLLIVSFPRRFGTRKQQF